MNHIIADGTIDTRVMDALGRKNDVQNALLDAVRAEVNG